jgi:hypothetical protein
VRDLFGRCSLIRFARREARKNRNSPGYAFAPATKFTYREFSSPRATCIGSAFLWPWRRFASLAAMIARWLPEIDDASFGLPSPRTCSAVGR